MKKNRIATHAAAVALAVGLASGSAMAVPTLQLYIAGGTYDLTTETIVSSAETFTLSAFWSAQGNKTTPSDNNFYIAMAVLDESGNPLPNTPVSLGSIVVNGAPISVTGDMVYGNPPLDTIQGFDPGDLSSHGIYDTFFYQTAAFAFDTSVNVGQFDAEACATNGGADCTPNMSKLAYRKDFNIDVSGLADGYRIHFDLYSVDVINCAKKGKPGEPVVPCTDVDADDFAPFSHDAESDGGTTITEVPEPGSIALLGAAVIGAGFLARRRIKK